IFSLGRDLMDTLKGRPTGRPLRLTVGVADVVPKLVAYRLLEPALHLPEPVQLICHEGTPPELLTRLAVYELDLVLSDSPIGPDVKVRAFNHLLGECSVSIFGTKELATKYRRRSPSSLDGTPFIIPTGNTALRRALEHWFDSKDIRPSAVGEFEDSALLKVFGQAGAGLFAAPTVIEKEVQRQYNVRVVGRLESVRERFYAISVEKKVKHPAVVAIADEARQRLFD
ncbi:unnamed protein product, partial [marine sediment metagenome]